MLIIGIAGGTGSGKTTVVNKDNRPVAQRGGSSYTAGFILSRQLAFTPGAAPGN